MNYFFISLPLAKSIAIGLFPQKTTIYMYIVHHYMYQKVSLIKFKEVDVEAIYIVHIE